MATVNFLCVDSHSEIGEFKVSVDYDDGTLAILDANIDNTTGDTIALTIGSFTTDVLDGASEQVDLTSFNIFMVNTPRGPRPPVFVG